MLYRAFVVSTVLVAVAVAATRADGDREAAVDVDVSAMDVAHSSRRGDACFLGHRAGDTLRYELTTAAVLTNDVMHARGHGLHGTAADATPVRKTLPAHNTYTVRLDVAGVSDIGLTDFKMTVESVHMEIADRAWSSLMPANEHGEWTPERVDRVQLDLLNAHPFYFSQACNMSIVHVWYPKDERALVVREKKTLVAAFHDVVVRAAGPERHTVSDADELGALERTVEHHADAGAGTGAADDDAITVVSGHNADRITDVGAMPALALHTIEHRDQVALGKRGMYVTHHELQRAHYVGGVLQSVHGRGELVFPRSRAHKRESGNTERVLDEASFIGAHGEPLDALRDGDRPSAAVGGAFRYHLDVTQTLRLVAHERGADRRRRRKRDGAEDTAALHYDWLSELLQRRYPDREFKRDVRHNAQSKVTVDPAAGPATPVALLAALRGGEESQRATLAWLGRVQPPPVRLLIDTLQGAGDADGAATATHPVCTAPERRTLAVVLARLETADGERYLLAVARDEAEEWERRDAALIALSFSMHISAAALDAVGAMLDHGDDIVAGQAAMVYGAMVHNHDLHTSESTANKHRHVLYKRYLKSDTESLREATLHGGLQNSLKQLTPPAFIDPENMSKKRGTGFGPTLTKLLDQGKCPNEAACEADDYAHRVPPLPTSEQVQRLGSGSVFIEFKLVTNGDTRESPTGAMYFWGFVGGTIGAEIQGLPIMADKSMPIVAGYGLANFVSNEKAALRNCTGPFKLQIFFNVGGNSYLFKASDQKACFGLETTCTATAPPVEQRVYESLVSVEFTATYCYGQSADACAHEMEVKGFNLKLQLKILGDAGFDWFWGFGSAPMHGGTALVGEVGPSGTAELEASVAVQYDWLQVDITVKMQILKATLPITAFLNAETGLPCSYIGLETTALGGKVELGVTIEATWRVPIKLYEWPGLSFNLPFLQTNCCVICDPPCAERYKNNDFFFTCDYAVGECVCDAWHDGVNCDIYCPAGGFEGREECDFSGAPANVDPTHIDCFPSNVSGYDRQKCYCRAGWWGTSCSRPCPGLEKTGMICSGHGQCNAQGECFCDFEYFDFDCSTTCPTTNPISGAKCAENGRCVYTGSSSENTHGRAECQCYPNFVGVDCEAKCPSANDDRDLVCSGRGDCSMVNGVPFCLCNMGYWGDQCENADLDGSGTALRLSGGAAIVFERVAKLDRVAAEGNVMFAFWLRPVNGWPETFATIVECRLGAVRLDHAGTLMFCSSLENECIKASNYGALQLDVWQFFTVVVSYASAAWTVTFNAYVTSWQVGVDTGSVSTKFAEFEIGVRLGERLNAQLDMLSVSSRTYGSFVQADFDKFRAESVARSQPGLNFLLLFDLKRGDSLYDEVGLASGKFPAANGTLERSGIELQLATVDSEVQGGIEFAQPFEVKSRQYLIKLDGRLVRSASVTVKFSIETGTCQLAVSMNGVAGGTSPPLSAQGTFLLDLSPAATAKIQGPMGSDPSNPSAGDNYMNWTVTGTCNKLSILESYFSVRTKAIDSVAMFTGSHYSYGAVNFTASSVLSLPFSVSFWMFRDLQISTLRGYPLIVSPIGATFVNGDEDSPFYIMETGSNGYGVRVRTVSGTNHAAVTDKTDHNFYAYRSAVGRWVFMTISYFYDTATQSCKITVQQNAINVVLNAASIAGYDRTPCPGGATRVVRHVGDTTFQMRFGKAFSGRLNNIMISSDTYETEPKLVTLRSALWMEKLLTDATAWLSYTFEGAQGAWVEPIKKPSGAGANTYRMELNMGSLILLKWGMSPYWLRCPGTTYYSPEMVCSTYGIYEHGVCFVTTEENTADDADFACRCNHGFYYDKCQGVCPGGEGTPCSMHGQCVTTNNTVCLCDPEYTGPACEHLCPGLRPEAIADGINTLRLPCLGSNSRCVMNREGTDARCVCDNGDGPPRTGSYCQFIVGQPGAGTTADGCENCNDPNAYCESDVCRCAEGFYRYFSICRANGASALAAPQFLWLAALLVITIALRQQ